MMNFELSRFPLHSDSGRFYFDIRYSIFDIRLSEAVRTIADWRIGALAVGGFSQTS
jgi:hypothetical protein